MFTLLFLIEFACIFFLSRSVSKSISKLLLFVTRSDKATIYLLSFLFLPGVIIHELAHWIMANVLFVRTGEIEFLPVIHGNSVKLGSVAIEKTDPVRRFFIGIAPILFGLFIIFSIYTVFFHEITLTLSWKEVALFYLLFEIGNTMYSSGKDMEGAIGFFIIALFLTIIFVFCYFFFKLHLPDSFVQSFLSTSIQGSFLQMDVLLGMLIVIDFVITRTINFFVH